MGFTYFLTSSPFGPDSPYFNPQNGFVDRLRKAVPGNLRGLFVCSSPDRPELTDRFAGDTRYALESMGCAFSAFDVLDRRRAEETAALTANAGLIVLAGGHVPTQNAFFREIGLKQALKRFHGVLIGISAGTMNSADPVYAQPEEEGEAASREYRRFLPGLGITKTMLLPHYQMVKDDVLDGMKLFDEITLPDSVGRRFYAIPDGSYLFVGNGREELRGEAYAIRDGAVTKVAGEGDVTFMRGCTGVSQT